MLIDHSGIFAQGPAIIDQMYEQFKRDPAALDADWQLFFQGFDFASQRDADHPVAATGAEGSQAFFERELKVFRLIQSYRSRGHLLAKTNPVRPRKDRHPYLELEVFGLSTNDLKESFYAGQALGLGKASLEVILQRLQQIYCSSLGFEFMHIADTQLRRWLRQKIEASAQQIDYPAAKKKRILQRLNEATVFESFLDTKYVGQKRFSLEGGENTITALDAFIEKIATLGAKEVVLGMAHRGRLNVLANVMGKTYEYIFNEFEGQARPDLSFGDGDVKYHLGYDSELHTQDGHQVYVKLMPNPSHLEAVGPVVMGHVRGLQDQWYEKNVKAVVPFIIHGDAAVAGQGIVYESLQFSNLKAHTVGGSIHFVINNQIGFTTDFEDARTSTYATSVAKTIDAPVIHVNGDDAEAVVYAMEFAAEYRQTFGRDIFIDMVCYRKHGHNESDEPRFTQPHLYELIKSHPNPREVYLQKLLQGGRIETELAQKMEQEFRTLLQERFNLVKQKPLPYLYPKPQKQWNGLKKAVEEDFHYSPPSGVPIAQLEQVYQALVTLPADFKPIIKAQKVLEERKKKWNTAQVDWSLGELLAYGSLCLGDIHVRLNGQDSIRGTFSHRHVGIFDTGGKSYHNALAQLNPQKGSFQVYNSPLSEYGVLAFEYGHSLVAPGTLTLWEAQFGDFANGAQTIFDQFISGAESKWQRMSSLVCLLPHGYEGQGPEHSSARLERFLQLCADLNMVVINPTTPANMFHALRRQVLWNFRKPLIVMTPKSLLRHPDCISALDDLTRGSFQEIMVPRVEQPHKIKRVLCCSGKVYYDLMAYGKQHQRDDVLVVRFEQLYPLPQPQLQQLLQQYSSVPFFWVQEEPKNMGAWSYLLRYNEFREFNLISRKASASVATGYASVHAEQQAALVSSAFKLS